MISAAEAQLVGWPLPASVVARTESIRNWVAFSCSVFNVSCSEVSTGMTSLLRLLRRAATITHALATLSRTWPFPIPDLRLVNAVFVRISKILYNLVAQPILYMRSRRFQPGNAVDDVDCQIESVYLV